MVHPDASFTLEYRGRWRPYLLEFERRATTPGDCALEQERERRAQRDSYHHHSHGEREIRTNIASGTRIGGRSFEPQFMTVPTPSGARFHLGWIRKI